jgi:hypothetical protein
VSSGGSGGGDATIYVVLGIVLLIVVRRMRVVFRGSKVSKARGLVFSAYYFLIAAVFISLSFIGGGVAPYYVVAYVVVGAAAYGSYLFSDKRIGFWKGADGSIYYRGAVIIYVIYLVGLAARIAIELIYIGPQAFTFTPSAGAATLSASAINGELATDILLSLGSGLLIGRNARVAKRYASIVKGNEALPDTPPKISLT